MENISEKSKKVCIIDDEDDIREIYSMKFKLEGFEVISAADGEAGLKLMREQKPDIILLDLQMPVKNGLDVLAEMKKDDSIKSIPVVVLSNISDEKTFARVGKFRTHFYIVKALTTPQKVVDIVHEVLRW
ncbi:MAG: response regulator [Candidatus Moranbacteria bacterium CG_4_9_14_3_um_filter_40_7]|nr:MAG: response regulator [Candidatus Moranbacteria bacterium CG23_combo_of_CG06-09_8_20_14_all_40_16]PIU81090.1 MAG: response regulator [Candidatus Moranbacteria bacterium CG06_land_8_20_14_3_00_40_12]PJA87681.1 MAG: response regulator [Candidatus Moranbacteria bacterium CG_4_9_14_3_um_filter_40_7]